MPHETHALPMSDDGLERLVAQLATERRLDPDRLRSALLGDPELRLLRLRERELRTVRPPSAQGLLRIAFLMAEAAERVARALEESSLPMG